MAQWDGMNSYTEPLTMFARRYKPLNILEIGLGYEGYSTTIWLEETAASVTTIDKADWADSSKRLTKKYPKFNFILGKSEDILPTLKDKYDLIYIDGDHRYEGAKKDIELCIPLLAPNGVLLLDDYGVEVAGGVDVDEIGRPMDGMFGVGKAADEVLKDWKQVYKEINFANGARAYVKT